MRKQSPRKARATARDSSGLADFQRALAGALSKPLNEDETMTQSNRAVAQRWLRANDRLTSFERLQIYSQQYWWRLLGSFGEDFRGLRAVLGEKRFERLATEYLAQHGSTSWTLRNLGSKLVEFLDANPQLTRPKTALALDVARVEWARVLAFDEAARKPIAPEKLAHIRADRLRLSLQPYVVLLELSHPVDALMRKLKHAEFSAVSNAVSRTGKMRTRCFTIRRSRKPVFLAVHRIANSVYFKRHEPEAHALLIRLRDGETLGNACAAVFARSKLTEDKCAAMVRGWFSRWSEFGWFCEPAR